MRLNSYGGQVLAVEDRARFWLRALRASEIILPKSAYQY